MFAKNIESKKYNLIGSLLTFTSIVVFGLSFYIYLTPLKAPDYKALENASVTKCENFSRRNGFLFVKGNGGFDVKYRFPKSPNIMKEMKEKLYLSSIVIEHCDNFKVKEYCLGECAKSPDGNITLAMKLEYIYKDK